MAEKKDRFMLLVIFLNIFCCAYNFLRGEFDAGLAWFVALMWSVRVHSLEIRMEKMKGGKKEEEDDDFTRFLG